MLLLLLVAIAIAVAVAVANRKYCSRADYGSESRNETNEATGVKQFSLSAQNLHGWNSEA